MTLIETLRAWAEAFEDATIKGMTVEEVTLVNGGAVSDDLRHAAELLEQHGDQTEAA